MFDVTTVQRDAVAHGDFILENCWFLARARVHDAIVLDVGTVADANVIHIASQYRVAPDGRLFAYVNVADDLCTFVDVSRRVYAGFVFAESSNHFRVIVA